MRGQQRGINNMIDTGSGVVVAVVGWKTRFPPVWTPEAEQDLRNC
jgi:hypothetical protein